MIVQTPGVYISEKNNIPTSLEAISTALPAFIGFTEQPQVSAVLVGSMLEFEEYFGGGYQTKFDFQISAAPDYTVSDIVPDRRFFLYDSTHLYFRNGGGPCYIFSAGTYADFSTTITETRIKNALAAQIALLDDADKPTLVLAPDLHMQFSTGGALKKLTGGSHFAGLCQQILNSCGDKQNKFAIFDYHQKDADTADMRNWMSPISGNEKFGAVYYPWLKNNHEYELNFEKLTTSIASGSTIESSFVKAKNDLDSFETFFGGFKRIDDFRNTYHALKSDLFASNTKRSYTLIFRYLYLLIARMGSVNVTDPELVTYKTNIPSNVLLIQAIKKLYRFKGLSLTNSFLLTSATFLDGNGNTVGWPGPLNPLPVWFNEEGDSYTVYADVESDPNLLNPDPISGMTKIQAIDELERQVDLQLIFSTVANFFEKMAYRKNQLEKQLFTTDLAYKNAATAIQNYIKEIPSQGAIAGVYCRNDRDRGVWKSPANIGLQGIEKPLIEVSNQEQDGLNVDVNTGKSINVIRTFTGKGPIVWGARTLDGRSSEWRYIAVRRFFIYAEQFLKSALAEFVFEPNNPRTWVKMRAVVTSFMVENWKKGALVGTKIEEAFFVEIDENTTTPADILAGIVKIKIGMAVAKPAEFIVIEFSQQFSN